MRIQVSDDLNLNYVEAGSGAPLVLAPAGPGGNMAHLQPHLSLFSDQYRVLTYDARGGGESDWTDWYSYQACCDDLAAFLRALDIEKAVIYGGSGGGIFCLHFALRYPDLVRALVLDGSSAQVNFGAAKNWRMLAEKTLIAGRDVTAEVTGPSAFAGNEFRVVRQVQPEKESDPRAQFAFYYGISELYEHPLSDRLGEIACPVLVLIGEQDKLAGVGGSVKIHRAIPSSELRILPECGHTVLGTRPDLAQHEMLAFLQGV